MGRPARTSAKPNVMGCAAAAPPLPRLYVNVAMPTECSRTAPTAASGPDGTAERWSRTGPLARSAASSPRGTPRVGRCALRRRDGTPCGRCGRDDDGTHALGRSVALRSATWATAPTPVTARRRGCRVHGRGHQVRGPVGTSSERHVARKPRGMEHRS